MRIWNPVNAAISGLLLSICVLFFSSIYGRVLGISGILSQIIYPQGGFQSWRLGFLLGLVLIGMSVNPSNEWSHSLSESLISGFLVGLGTSLGSGCTSGHGLCGLARLSLRSFTAVVTFMIFGMITRMLTLEAHWTRDPLVLETRLDPVLLPAFACALGIYILIFMFTSKTPKENWPALTAITSLGVGAFFGLGLMSSGMTDPLKVKAFLALPTYFESRPRGTFSLFDPSLAFVMGGGMLPSLIVMPLIQRLAPRPRWSESWGMPTQRLVDFRLVIGSALFGIGWGYGGICPGPGVVVALPRLLAGQTDMAYWWGAYILGLFLSKRI